MAKHSFVYDANSFKGMKPKVSRFKPDHPQPQIKGQKSQLQMAFCLGILGFIIMFTGLVLSTREGIMFSSSGSIPTIIAFILAGTSKPSKGRFGWREAVLISLMLPAWLIYVTFTVAIKRFLAGTF